MIISPMLPNLRRVGTGHNRVNFILDLLRQAQN